MQIPKDLIEKIKSLENIASEIVIMFIDFIRQAPLNHHPSSRGGVISIGFPEYSWALLPSELEKVQGELVGIYRSWYNQSLKLVKTYLPGDFEEFKKYYKGKNPPKEFEIIDILQLNVQVWDGNKKDVIMNFNRKFSSQKNILLTFKHLELEENNVQKKEKIDKTGEYSKRIFLIHGHDEAMKQSVARSLEKLGLTPIILHEQANEGKTIIEKFEKYSDVGFCISLLSPDDMGYSIKEGKKKTKTRARQNVILETGYFIGKLGREHVILLYKEENDFEFPSDYRGIVYIPYDDKGAWKFKIIKELNSQGYSLDANLLI